jgi:hypothetical protein
MNPLSLIALRLVGIDASSGVNVPMTNLTTDTVHTVLQIVFGLAGGAALVIIVVSGLRFVTSQGEPEKTNKARNTIIYAIVGLVVSILAYSIVTFITGNVS